MRIDSTDNSKAGNDSVLELFFSLIRCGIGKEKELMSVPTPEEWEALFDIARKHTLAGIAFNGIQSLPQEQLPPKHILLQWYSISEKIKKQSIELTKRAIAVSQKFREEGFGNCILKGQGIARLYPVPELRTPGDIDIWVEGGCDRVLQYIRSITPDCKPTYHHVDFDILPDIDIEVHYRPTWMYSPAANRRLQKFFTRTQAKEFGNTIDTPQGKLHAPTTAFNRVFIPIHIYRHLFDEGIGLRQILDYYFVLLQGFTEEEKAESRAQFRQFGISRFMRALMYVMKEIFDIDDEYLITEPNTKSGKFLLHEIMTAGNFGMYDPRYGQVGRGFTIPHFKSQARRMSMLVTQYPTETFWSPFFKIWHYFWRKSHTGGLRERS